MLENESEFFFGYYRNEKKLYPYSEQFSLCGRGGYIGKGGEIFCERCMENAECNGGYTPIIPQKNVNYLYLIR